VALQELDSATERSQGKVVLDELAKKLGLYGLMFNFRENKKVYIHSLQSNIKSGILIRIKQSNEYDFYE
jgi:hypothetical protein